MQFLGLPLGLQQYCCNSTVARVLLQQYIVWLPIQIRSSKIKVCIRAPGATRRPPRHSPFEKQLVKLYGPQPDYVESRASSWGYVESIRLRLLDFQICFRKDRFSFLENRCLDSWDQNKILKILNDFRFFIYMDSISMINHHFLAPSPLKPLQSSPGYQNLPGVLPRTHSDHRGPVSAQCCHLS